MISIKDHIIEGPIVMWYLIDKNLLEKFENATRNWSGRSLGPFWQGTLIRPLCYSCSYLVKISFKSSKVIQMFSQNGFKANISLYSPQKPRIWPILSTQNPTWDLLLLKNNSPFLDQNSMIYSDLLLSKPMYATSRLQIGQAQQHMYHKIEILENEFPKRKPRPLWWKFYKKWYLNHGLSVRD